MILAGGRSQRMGGVDKAFLTLGGETLIARTIARAKPQVGELLINANGDSERFAGFGLPVIPDAVGGFLGPVAGILAALEWMRAKRSQARWLASFSCDCPFFPIDLVDRLIDGAQHENVPVAIAASGARHHPVFAVWSSTITATSQGALVDRGLRKMDDFVALFLNARVGFASDPIDPFFNINTPYDLAHAETRLANDESFTRR
ncbi:MAG TPA: molybdenum cofactor guanylyltransferase MobA [Micropepsaceae bacterium]